MAYQHLAPFDPSRSFVLRQPKRIAGRAYAKGELLDAASLDPRLVRMLYDHHQIGYEGEQTRRDIRSAHPRRRDRAGAETEGAPPRRAKGPTQRPITNPNRRRRARSRPEVGADAGGAQAAAQSAGEAPESAPAASAPPAPAANDRVGEREARIAKLVRDNDKPTLIAQADKLPGFKSSMSKTQLAALIVGPDDGAA